MRGSVGDLQQVQHSCNLPLIGALHPKVLVRCVPLYFYAVPGKFKDYLDRQMPLYVGSFRKAMGGLPAGERRRRIRRAAAVAAAADRREGERAREGASTLPTDDRR